MREEPNYGVTVSQHPFEDTPEKYGILSPAIISFSGPYRFLSNFAPALVFYEEQPYPSVENAYQAAKCPPNMRSDFRGDCSPAKAKRLGRDCILPRDWEERKLGIMKELVTEKFSYETFRLQLVATGELELVEGNTWGDTFWGVSGGVGLNHLGRILMEVRAALTAKGA
jgi:ribA/ribD-fused uncharacterized protein